MTTFQVHTIDSAPEESKHLLTAAKETFGSIPNLLGVFAESPAMLQTYLDLGKILESTSAFDPTELQIVLMTTSFENGCDYCMAAHSAIAGLQDVPEDVIQSLRDGTPIRDPRLEALRAFVRTVVEKRGFAAEEDVEAFLAAGYTKRHILEVILGVGFKTLSNFTNHIARTPLDRRFQKRAWSRSQAVTGT